MNTFKKIAIAGIALLGAATANAQTYTGVSGTGWREIAVPMPSSSMVHIQSASPATADHADVLLQIDDANGLANAPLPQVVKDNLLRDGLGDGPVMVDRDLAFALADGTYTTKYAQYITPDSPTAYDTKSIQGSLSGGGSTTAARMTAQRVTPQGIFCSSGWQQLTLSDTIDGLSKSLTKNLTGGSLTFTGAAAIKGDVKIVVEYKRSDFSGCMPYTFRLKSVIANGTVDMANSRVAITASVNSTVVEDSTPPDILWERDGVFYIGWLPVWYSVKVPFQLGYKVMVGAAGTVDYSSQMTGVVPFTYTCQSRSCSGTSDTSKLNMTSSTPNLGIAADVVVDPWVKVSVKGQLYPIFNSALASVGLGLKFSTPLQLYGYYGNACGDSNADGTNEMLNTYFIDLQARLSLEVTYSLIDKEGASMIGNGDWASNKISGALYRVLNSEGRNVPLWHKALYYKDWSPGNASIFSPILRLQSSYINNGVYNYIVRTSMRPCVALDTNYLVTEQGAAGTTVVTVTGRGGYTDTTYTSSSPTLTLTPTGVRDDSGRVFSASNDIAPNFVYLGTGYGTFQYVGMTRTSPGGSNDVATITLKNVGTGTITNVARTCSGASFHAWGTVPSIVLPGSTIQIQCQAAASGSYAPPVVSVTGTNANNSPFTPY